MKTKLFLFFLLTALGGNAQCWQKIDSGLYHTLALASNGTLWAWGYNNAGQLGDGTTTNRTQPVQNGTATDWVSVHAGYYHSFAIKQAGLNGLRWLLSAGIAKKEDANKPQPVIEAPDVPPPPPRTSAIRVLRHETTSATTTSSSMNSQSRAVLIANAWSFSAILAILMLRFLF